MASNKPPATPPEGSAREWLARESEREREWERARPARSPRQKIEVSRWGWFWVFAAIFGPLRWWVLPGLIGYWPSWIITAFVIWHGSWLWGQWWRKRKAARTRPA